MIFNQNAVKLTNKHPACQKNFRGQAPGPPGEQRRGERERGGERMERGGIGLHHFSDQSYAPAGKHTSRSNNRSTTRSTTVLLVVVLNAVCRVQ
jgi:hypothetical protein